MASCKITPLSFLFPSLKAAELPRQDRFCLSRLVINQPVGGSATFPLLLWDEVWCQLQGPGPLLVPRDVSLHGNLSLLPLFTGRETTAVFAAGSPREDAAARPLSAAASHLKLQLCLSCSAPSASPRCEKILASVARVWKKSFQFFILQIIIIYLLGTLFTDWALEQTQGQTWRSYMQSDIIIVINYWWKLRSLAVSQVDGSGDHFQWGPFLAETLWMHNLHDFAVLILTTMIWGSYSEMLK